MFHRLVLHYITGVTLNQHQKRTQLAPCYVAIQNFSAYAEYSPCRNSKLFLFLKLKLSLLVFLQQPMQVHPQTPLLRKKQWRKRLDSLTGGLAVTWEPGHGILLILFCILEKFCSQIAWLLIVGLKLSDFTQNSLCIWKNANGPLVNCRKGLVSKGLHSEAPEQVSIRPGSYWLLCSLASVYLGCQHDIPSFCV